jgi:hypothetical protein
MIGSEIYDKLTATTPLRMAYELVRELAENEEMPSPASLREEALDVFRKVWKEEQEAAKELLGFFRMYFKPEEFEEEDVVACVCPQSDCFYGGRTETGTYEVESIDEHEGYPIIMTNSLNYHPAELFVVTSKRKEVVQ